MNNGLLQHGMRVLTPRIMNSGIWTPRIMNTNNGVWTPRKMNMNSGV